MIAERRVYMWNRWQDPSLGRFISQDPARDSSNWYAYAGGNPINNVDPMGLRDWESQWDLINHWTISVDGTQSFTVDDYIKKPQFLGMFGRRETYVNNVVQVLNEMGKPYNLYGEKNHMEFNSLYNVWQGESNDAMFIDGKMVTFRRLVDGSEDYLSEATYEWRTIAPDANRNEIAGYQKLKSEETKNLHAPDYVRKFIFDNYLNPSAIAEGWKTGLALGGLELSVVGLSADLLVGGAGAAVLTNLGIGTNLASLVLSFSSGEVFEGSMTGVGTFAEFAIPRVLKGPVGIVLGFSAAQFFSILGTVEIPAGDSKESFEANFILRNKTNLGTRTRHIVQLITRMDSMKELLVSCPYCGKEKNVFVGKYQCKNCGTKFSVNEIGETKRIFERKGKIITGLSVSIIMGILITLMSIFAKYWSFINFAILFGLFVALVQIFSFFFGYVMVLRFSRIEEKNKPLNKINRIISLFVTIVLFGVMMYVYVLILLGHEIKNKF